MFCFFLHRFFDKTKNEWEHRDNFKKEAGKYDVVFMDYSTDEKVKKTKIIKIVNPESVHFLTRFVSFCMNISNYFRRRKIPW